MDDDIRETTQALGNALALVRRLKGTCPDAAVL
jgi:hypothetical protein